MSERFFLAEPPSQGRGRLVGDEARHLVRVMRCRVGDEVVVFDGRGMSWQARVAAVGRDEAVVDLGAVREASPPPTVPLTLAVALPKGERQRWLVEKLTELGVERLLPLVTTRGVAEATPAAVERLRRGVIEACKQCGRDTLMAIGEPRTCADLARDRGPETSLVVADRDGSPFAEAVGGPQPLTAVVGPEGGLTAEEITVLEAHGGRRVTLGPHVLRVETAAIAVAARLA
ncbi:MAG: RsmE family RNA methyltransferase [Planctomycetaceae bacterium]